MEEKKAGGNEGFTCTKRHFRGEKSQTYLRVEWQMNLDFYIKAKLEDNFSLE